MFIYHYATWSNNILCLSPVGAVPAAAQCGRGGHPSPLSYTTFCSPLITVNYNRGTAHFSGESLLLGLSTNPSQVVQAGCTSPTPTRLTSRGQCRLADFPLPSTQNGWETECVHNSTRQDEKPRHSIAYKCWILHFVALCHVPGGLL